MHRRLIVCLLFVIPGADATARTRAAQHPADIPSPSTVMWIAAHPDDEAVAAPLLSLWCREQRARCAFLVLTRGEAGLCLRPEGCMPDIATVRSAEEAAASQYFNADLILLTLPDGVGATPPSWPDMTSTIAAYIEAVHPDLILTFDPRHGTTCHPDHRATANIVLESVKRLTFRPAVYLLETRISIGSNPLSIHFTSGAAAAQRFDGNATWNAVIEDMQRHPSQFDSRWIAAIESVSPAERAVFIAPLPNALEQAAQTCP